MKKTIFVILALVLLSLLSAHHLTPLEPTEGAKFNYSGDFRARAIMFNDFIKDNGGWFDNRLQLNFNTNVTEQLGVTWNMSAGDIIWGDAPTGGAYYTRGINLKTRELFLDYNLGQLGLPLFRARIGQQYWCEPTSLILDDDFSGITFDAEFSKLVLEAGYIKGFEGMTNKLDDMQYGFVNAKLDMPISVGVFGMYGQNQDLNSLSRTADAWVVPYVNASIAPIDVSLAVVANNQWFHDAMDKVDSEMGLGVTAKANIDIGLNLGVNALYVNDKGINSLSPYYSNGLVIFGINSDFDSSCIGWGNSSYGGVYNSGEAMMSIVGKASYPVMSTVNVFAAGGFLTLDDPLGIEANAGVDIEFATGTHFIGIAAAGQSDKGIEASMDNDNNIVYFVGGQIKTGF